MSSSLISQLKTLIEGGGSDDKIKELENAAAEENEKIIKEDSFYELPTNEILKIVEKSENEDAKLLYELISRMSEREGKEAALLLNVIKMEKATLEECIKILSSFKQCPLCQRTDKLFREEEKTASKRHQS